MFDIVIPVGPKDIDLLKLQLQYTMKNILNYRNIYIVLDTKIINMTDLNLCPSEEKDTEENIFYIDESIFPFNLKSISLYHKKYNKDRNGWYLQQLIKLYSGIVIPGILERYLVIDTDTFFLKPTQFISDNDKLLYSYGKEYHMPYFIHMKKICNEFEKIYKDKSGICHHMIFDSLYIKELFEKVEKIHKKDFWILFLLFSDMSHPSSASEYEIYFNYVFKYHKDKVELRKLDWDNVGGDIKNINQIISKNSKCDFVSYHWYMRK
jgi:hypothetical protein